jgi:hypothetical protein
MEVTRPKEGRSELWSIDECHSERNSLSGQTFKKWTGGLVKRAAELGYSAPAIRAATARVPVVTHSSDTGSSSRSERQHGDGVEHHCFFSSQGFRLA